MAPSEAATSDFGARSVVADGKLVVSWPRLFTGGQEAGDCGEIITYEKNAQGEYQELSRLNAADLVGSCEDGDAFGAGLSYSNGKLAIGMPAGLRKGYGFSGNAKDTDSRVFITHFANQNWALEQTLVVSDLVDGKKGMATRVVLDGDILLVEANTYATIFDVSFSVANGVYVFEDDGNGFEEVQKLTENYHLYGFAMDAEDNQIIVGSFGEQNTSSAGRVYVYEKNADTWQNVQIIDDSRNINLGTAVHVLDNKMVLGGPSAFGNGGVVVLEQDDTGMWSEVQFIEASDAKSGDQFGFDADLFGDDLIVGAPQGGNDNASQGAAYVYKKDANGLFVETQKLTSQISTASNANRFGANIHHDDTDLFVTAVSGFSANQSEATSFQHFSRASTPNTTYPASSRASGSWKVDGASNQNIEIEMLQDGRVLLFASLNNSGDSFWMLAIGQVDDNVIDFAHVISTSGAKFGLAFNSSDVIQNDIGQMQIAFSQCDKATLSYDLTNISTAEVTISKYKEIPGNECQPLNKALPNGVSGAWFNSSRSGEGFTHYLYEQDGVQMSQITWYTYDASGNQMWLTGEGEVNGQTVNINEMTMFTGANLFSGTATQTVVGSLSMTWDDCHNAQMSYDFNDFGLGNGNYNLSQLTVLDNTRCDLKK